MDRRLTPADLRSFELTKYRVVNEKSKRDGLSPILAASSNGHLDVVRCLVKNGANINDLNLDGQTPLILAAKNGHQPLLRLLVNYGAKLDIQDAKGRTALMHALAEGRLELARCLLGAGASQVPVDRDGKTALFVAAECGHVAIVEHLLVEKTGADLAVRDRHGRTVLMMLARAGKAWPIYKYISESRLAEIINDRDSAGYTPLLHAVEAGKFSMAARLIKWGADVKAVTEDGRTVIMLACQRPQISCSTADSDPVDFGPSNNEAAKPWDQKTFVAEMMKQGVAIDAADDKGRTALFHVAEYAELSMLQHLILVHHKVLQPDGKDSAGNTVLHAAARLGRESIVRYLTELPALVRLINEPNLAAEMPIRLAIMSKNLNLVKLLLDSGASLEKANSCSETPLLCVACENRTEDIVSFLLDRGFQPDCADAKGVTPLMAATRSGSLGIVERLLKASASVNMLSKKGFSALSLAVQTASLNISTVLLNHKANPNLMPEGKSECKTPCSIAATLNGTVLLELLLDSNADPFQMDSQGRNALYYSVLLNRTNLLKVLTTRNTLEHFNMDSLFDYEGKQYTLLHIAAERRSLEAMKFILQATNPNLEFFSSDGETPLHIACRQKDLAMVNVLTPPTAKLDIPRRGDNFTPLMIAGKQGSQSIAMELIAKGADVNRRSPEGFTVLNLAIMSDDAPGERIPLANLLLTKGAKYDSQDLKIVGSKAYNLLQALYAGIKNSSPQAKKSPKAQTAQSTPTVAQTKPKMNSTPMTTEERLKAKLKKKQSQPAETPKPAEVQPKKTESFAVRAKKARDEVQRTVDTAETNVKRISNMMKKYVEVTVLPSPHPDDSEEALVKEMKKQDVTRVYRHPSILSSEQMQQNRLVSEFSKKMDTIRLEIVKKFERKLDMMCRREKKQPPKNGKVPKPAAKATDIQQRDSTTEKTVDKRQERMRSVRRQALYKLKFARKSKISGENSVRSAQLRRLKTLSERRGKKCCKYRLPRFWEIVRQREVLSRFLETRMRWLIEAAKLSEAELFSQYSYVKLEGVAAGIQGASVCWQLLPEQLEIQKESRAADKRLLRSLKGKTLRSHVTRLATNSGQRCNLLLRCGQRPAELKLLNSWSDKQMQLDLSWSLQPELFHVRQRIPHDRRPDIAVRLTVDTRCCLWDSRELRLLANSLANAPSSATPDDATMQELERQRRTLDCLAQRRTYHHLQAAGGAPRQLDTSSDAALLHPMLTTKLLTVALHVGLARFIEIPYSVHGDDFLLYQQPTQKELKLLRGLLGYDRVKLVEARRFPR
ncbi:hypothetical protein BOX15_Mlig028949g3 [Macrostomum lignano]|uniref:Uncharacterized protein n=1 Tax=Macrostomum lignano TaxID=282301 RepID=A0A267DDD2_9PLAT|nr:hypothetical protein BOX15_Mlig028949g3 [Macrostomum lignano]